MKLLKDVRCDDCSYTFETYLETGAPTPRCHECGGPTKSIISGTSFTLEGCSGDFPGAHMKWAKKRQEKITKETSQGITAFGEPNL